MSTFIHPTAIVDAGVQIGEGTKIWHFVHVSEGARIGADCTIGQGCFVGRGVRIGNGVRVQNHVSIYEGVEVEDGAFLGPSCVFTNVLNPRAFVARKTEFRPTRVGRGASVGANAVIVCGHDLGEFSFVGAGAVVTKDVAPYALVVGNPAHRIGWMSRAGARLPDGENVRCPQTGERYQIEGERCVALDGPDLVAQAIPLVDLEAQNSPLREGLQLAVARVLRDRRFILGPEVQMFEREIATALGVRHAVGVSSGTDALLVSLMALGVTAGDEVITTTFSFFATGGAIARLGATPVFVDIEPDTFNIDVAQVVAKRTDRTAAIIPVHLFGQPADVTAIKRALPDVPIVEDAAQAIGAGTAEGPAGGLGAFGAFSFFPSKNLGGFGDAGLVTTQDPERATTIRRLRAHGAHPKYVHASIGGNFRIDELQAALLRVKLPHLPRWTRARQENAALYERLFAEAGLGPDVVKTPARVHPGHVYNQYVIRAKRRDDLATFLAARGIASAVYYPIPLHRQECFAYLGLREGSLPHAERASREVLALPIYPEMGEARIRRVVSAVKEFFS